MNPLSITDCPDSLQDVPFSFDRSYRDRIEQQLKKDQPSPEMLYADPVLMLIYPLCVTLIILALCEKLFGGSRYVYICVTIFTAVPAVVDFLKALGVSAAAEFGSKVFPFFDLSLGWVVPAIIGLVLGVVLAVVNKGKSGKAAA